MTTDIQAGRQSFRFLLATGLRLGQAYGGHGAGQYSIVPASRRRTVGSIGSRCQRSRWPNSIRHPGKPGGEQRRSGSPTARKVGRLTTCAAPSAPGTTDGHSAYIVEKMLNHMSDGVMAVYNHATYDAERPRRWRLRRRTSQAWRPRRRLSFLFARG